MSDPAPTHRTGPAPADPARLTDANRPADPGRLASIVVAKRYCGPPSSGNGGYVAGRLAATLEAGATPVTVTLRQPPPLEAPLSVSRSDEGAQLTFGGAVVASAELADLAVEPVDPVAPGLAAEAEAAYSGLSNHPFPTCFVCGSERPAPDGLGLRPGLVPGFDGVTAARWLPGAGLTAELTQDASGTVSSEFVWAALDCPGGWTNDLQGRPMVLGRITAVIDALPLVDDPCVVVGRLLGTEGRKTFTATTVYDSDERVLARAQATWFVVDPGAFS